MVMAFFSAGFVKPRSVNLDESPKAERWAVAPLSDQKKKLKSAKNALTRVGLSASVGDWEGCITAARQVPKGPVNDWVLYLEMTCAKKLSENGGKQKGSEKSVGPLLRETLKRIRQAESQVDPSSPLVERFHDTRISFELSFCQWLTKHAQWKDLRGEIQQLLKYEFQLTKADRAKLYFLSGELLVAERQWSDAYLQFDLARSLEGDPLIEGRLKNILPMLPPALREQYEKRNRPAPEANALVVTPSSDELDLYNQAQNYLIRNEPVPAVEAMGKLVKKFPNGVKARWAQDKIYELLGVELEKSRGPDGSSVAKRRIENEMLDFDPDRQLEWGKGLFDAQAYEDAAPLLHKAAEQVASSQKASKLFYLAARAYHLSGNDSAAKEIFRRMVKNYPMAPEFVDAATQWALINIHENDPAEGITHLEMARSRKMSNQQDLISLFWLFQCYKMKNTAASVTQTATELVQRFPLTYYGLIAFQELNKQLPQYEKQKAKAAKVFFSEAEWSALDRARILLIAGLLDEAGDELSIFSKRPLALDEGQYLAGFYVQALRYQKTFSLLSSLYDEVPEKRTDSLVRRLFPQEFWDVVNDEKKRSGLDPLLLLSVMRQESAFDPQAVSRSGAMGLLQMLPPTAEEVKKEINSNAQLPKDLFDPSTNVKFCAHYLARMLKKYGGSVPLALAAYNAGPSRITQFINSQNGILRDTWVDELPWAETSFYVKSILKNYVMYRILYGGLTQLPSPPWADSPKTSQK